MLRGFGPQGEASPYKHLLSITPPVTRLVKGPADRDPKTSGFVWTGRNEVF